MSSTTKAESLFASTRKESHTSGVSKRLYFQTAKQDTFSGCLYYGKETQLVENDLPDTIRVVQTLVELFHNKGYDLYVDLFYTSPLLPSELTKVGITVTGTLQSNQKGMPKDITSKRKREPRGNIRAARSGNILALSWLNK